MNILHPVCSIRGIYVKHTASQNNSRNYTSFSIGQHPNCNVGGVWASMSEGSFEDRDISL